MNTLNTQFISPNMADCQIVADAIAKENDGNEHMIHTTADQLLEASQNNGGLVLKEQQSGVLIAFVRLMVASRISDKPDDTIYEWGSLMVLPEFRGKGNGSKIVGKLLTDYHDRSIFCVTNVDAVAHCCQKNNQRELSRTKLSHEFKNIVDGPQEPCQGDRIFANSTLIEQHPYFLKP